MTAKITPNEKLIDLKPLMPRFFCGISSSIEHVLKLDRINEIHRAMDIVPKSSDNFFEGALKALGISLLVDDSDLDRIPETGPLVIVANHPFGGVDGVALGALLRRRRQDVRVLGNHLLDRIPGLADINIPVNPFRGADKEDNLRGLREAARWLRDGGCLMTFPAGEVSHLDLRHREIRDPEWSHHVASIARLGRATVLPVHFEGRNSLLFQAAGLVHARLRTLLLPREIVARCPTAVSVHVGKALPWSRLRHFDDDRECTRYFRLCVDLLKHRTPLNASSVLPRDVGTDEGRDIISPVPKDLVAADLEGLPPENLLVKHHNFEVWRAEAHQIPEAMRDIGRLREIAFRDVGEGTGKSLDLDPFDMTYDHLILWNRQSRDIVGAYRAGQVTRLLDRQGPQGVYTSTLYQYRSRFWHDMRDAVELGRSFIRPEYQRNAMTLHILWRGIAAYLVANPHLRKLFGPVSISTDYHDVSKELMVDALMHQRINHEMAHWVRPRHPFQHRRRRHARQERRLWRQSVRNVEDISVIVSQLEQDGKGIPVLLKHYLKLKATLLSFNIDPDFNDCLDGLVFVDLDDTDDRMIKRLMGPEGHASYYGTTSGIPRDDRESSSIRSAGDTLKTR